METMLTNEAFYDRLARFYDLMNDWPARLDYEGPFIRRVLEACAARVVLDSACGTGQHALALAQWGFTVSGADSSAQMIARARANAAAQGLNVPFAVASLDAVYTLPGAPFDAVLCLGNSLPHVCTASALHVALAGMAQAVRPGGALLLHNLNYDKRWVERPRFMKLDSGTLDGREVLVWRMADYGETQITFHTALFERDAAGRWTVTVNSTCQKPLFRAELEAELRACGFDAVHAYGNLQGVPFDAHTSDDLVLVAQKGC